MWSTILNPKTGRNVSVKTKLGKSILTKYVQHLKGGAGCTGLKKHTDPKCKATKGCVWQKGTKTSTGKRRSGKCVKVAVAVAAVSPSPSPMAAVDPLIFQTLAERAADNKTASVSKWKQTLTAVATVHSVNFVPPVSKELEDMGFFEGQLPNPSGGQDIDFFYRLSRAGETPVGGIQIVTVNTVWKETEDVMTAEKREILDGLISTLSSPKHGDLVENVGSSRYRSEALYVIKNTAASGASPTLKICNLDYSFDDYGHIGEDFSIGPEFPSGYWLNAPLKHASWHAEIEPVGVKIWSAIKSTDLVRKEREWSPTDTVVFWDYEQSWGTVRFAADSAAQVISALKKYKTSALGTQEGLNLYMDEGEISGFWEQIKAL